ncbi:hypothetical protein RJ55_07430 [Drechmeria coniospora]|nr:hypothetical protein RJ55_07430 [Drechmeria coniospora]
MKHCTSMWLRWLVLVLSFQWLGTSYAGKPTKPKSAVKPTTKPVQVDLEDKPDQGPPDAEERWKNSAHFPGKDSLHPAVVTRFDRRSPEEIFEKGFETRVESSGKPLLSASFVASRHNNEPYDDTGLISFSGSTGATLSAAQGVHCSGKKRFFGHEDWAKVRAYASACHNDLDHFDKIEVEEEVPGVPKGPPKGPPEPPPANKLHEGFKLGHWGYIVRPNSKFISMFGTLGPDGFANNDFKGERE